MCRKWLNKVESQLLSQSGSFWNEHKTQAGSVLSVFAAVQEGRFPSVWRVLNDDITTQG